MRNIARDPYTKSLLIQTIILRMNEKEAMKFLKDSGIEIADPSTWYRAKKKIVGDRFKRIRDIFDYEAIDEYLQSIETIKDCIKKMYDAADNEPEYWKKSAIYRDIIDSQPLLTEYYHNTRKVIQKDKQEKVIQELQT